MGKWWTGLGITVLFLVIASTGPARLATLSALPQKDGVPTLAPLLRKVTPGVVNIAVKSHVRATPNPLLNDPFFRHFFDMPEVPKEREIQSVGSGVIVDAKQGYVLTNHHVIEGAEEIIVTLTDRRRVAASLIGSDPGTEVALLKIATKNLTAVPMADSDTLEVGDFVVAIGNPFGLGQTVTSGIVSALGRGGLTVQGYEDFIQTDASINPGNSGGALINLKGELVGINTAIIAPAGGNVGIGFAIPTNMARAVMDQLSRYGKVQRGRIGIGIQDLTPELATAMGIKQTTGVIITAVEPGSPAEVAGLKASDVVIALNERPVQNTRELRNRIGLMAIGRTVKLTILRGGATKRTNVKIGKADENPTTTSGVSPVFQGAVFRDRNPTSHRRNRHGVLVESVRSGSIAWRHGLRAKDLITAVNRQKVKSVDQFERAVRNATGTIVLNIVRDDRSILVVVP